jgi:prepilin-type N-terminal cleavage/methylation domain-containing protein/prepilin-type processing-associated H-X9-DG protein
MRGKRRKSRGFTLVEMLVVITVICILVMMMVMGIQSAVRAALKAKCQNYMHELATSVLHYESNKGGFPGYANPLRLRTGVKPVSWVVVMLDYISRGDLWEQWLRGDEPQARLSMLICPAETVDSSNVGAMSYVGNDRLFVNLTNTTRVTRSDIPDASRTMLLAERTGAGPWYIANPTNLTFNMPSTTASATDTAAQITRMSSVLHSIHPNGANAAFCDAHVEFVGNSADTSNYY